MANGNCFFWLDEGKIIELEACGTGCDCGPEPDLDPNQVIVDICRIKRLPDGESSYVNTRVRGHAIRIPDVDGTPNEAFCFIDGRMQRFVFDTAKCCGSELTSDWLAWLFQVFGNPDHDSIVVCEFDVDSNKRKCLALGSIF